MHAGFKKSKIEVDPKEGRVFSSKLLAKSTATFIFVGFDL